MATSSAGKTVVVWTRSTSHAGDAATFAECSVRSTPTGSWSTPATVWDDATANVGGGPVGVVWMPARGVYDAAWVCMIGRTTFSGSTVTARSVLLTTSPDAVTWTPGTLDPFTASGSGVTWCYPSDLAWFDDGTDAGQLWASGYATYSASGGVARPVAVVSLDRGATWTHVGSPYGTGTQWQQNATDGTARAVPTALSEPTFYFTSGTAYAVHMVWRCDNDYTFRSVGVVPGASGWSTPQWSSVRGVLTKVSGEPVMHVSGDGTWHLFGRDTTRRLSDQYHCAWGWWTSPDGVTWTARGDFTATGRAAMYGAVTDLPDGSMIVAHAEEDGATWGPASVAVTSFTAPVPSPGSGSWSIRDVRIWDGSMGASAPGLLIDIDGPASSAVQVWRHTVTGVDGSGAYLFDPEKSVALRPLGDAMGAPVGQWWDFEAQQGVTYAYGLSYDDAQPGTDVTLPDAGGWLIPLQDPNLSAPLVVERDGWGDMSPARTQSIVEIPGADYSFAVDFGVPRAAAWTMTTVVMDAEGRQMLLDALSMPGPCYLSMPSDHYPMALGSPYVQPGKPTWTPKGGPSQELWLVQIPLTPIARPVGSVRVHLPGFPGLPQRFKDLATSFENLGS